MKASLQLEVEALLLVLQDDGADPPEEVGVVVGDPCFSSISALQYAIKCVLLDNNCSLQKRCSNLYGLLGGLDIQASVISNPSDIKIINVIFRLRRLI